MDYIVVLEGRAARSYFGPFTQDEAEKNADRFKIRALQLGISDHVSVNVRSLRPIDQTLELELSHHVN